MGSIYSELNDARWLQLKYVDEGLSTYQIAGVVGCHYSTVLYALHHCKIYVRSASEAFIYKHPKLMDEAWLREKYEIEKLTPFQIGKKIKCSRTPVYTALRRAGIHIRNKSEACRGPLHHHFGKELTEETKRRIGEGNKGKQYFGETNPMFGKKHSENAKSAMSVARIGRFGGEKHPMWGKAHTKATKQKMHIARGSLQLDDVEWLRQKYAVEKRSSIQIGKLVGCSSTNVLRALRQGRIPIRTYAEIRRLQRFPTHHTKPELQFEAICIKSGLPFEYTGDGKVWIGCKSESYINPDFTCNNGKKRFAIFVNGDYWHNPLLRPQLRKTQRPQFQISHSKKHRWVPIILWETDLKREDAEAFVLATLEKVGFSVPR